MSQDTDEDRRGGCGRLVMPELKGKLGRFAIRVPTINVPC